MSRLKLGVSLCLPLFLLMAASTVRAATLYVSCGGKGPLTSIGAALKIVQFAGPSTINVSGACHENVLVQSLDRVTLNAVNAASISDASGGKFDVISIQDSRDVAVNGFTINAGAGESINGITCGDFSICRLSHNVIQGATGDGGAGLGVFGQAEATLDSDVLQNNSIGLFMRSGTKVATRAGPFTSRDNGQGINIGRQAFALITAVVANNSGPGVVVQWQSTLELANGSISGNGNAGALVTQSSFTKFTNSTISGNAAGGVVVSDLSMVNFAGSTVNGNGGGTDIVCNPQYSATRGVGGTGGTTNCVEP